MQARTICHWKHDAGGHFAAAEKNTRRVLFLTVIVMVVEIVGGFKLNSMALLADGWHMATHVAAFLITVAVYALTRHYAKDDSFTFGTGKISVLGAFSSSIALGGIAVFMIVESVLRLYNPEPIRFGEAIGIACLGLAFNSVSAVLLGGHNPGCGHHHDCQHHAGAKHTHDLNLKAAYLHVLADAVTSVLAIIALSCGNFFGLNWLDPVMGLVGAVVVGQWAFSLLRDTSVILLDKQPKDSNLHAEIRTAILADSGTVITDLHLWQVAARQYAVIISIVTPEPKTPAEDRDRLKRCAELVHVTVEVHHCHVRESLKWGAGVSANDRQIRVPTEAGTGWNLPPETAEMPGKI